MIEKRLLITGSRDWDDYGTIARAMGIAIADLVDVSKTSLKQGEIKQKIIVVHGACPPKKIYDDGGNFVKYVGADYFADEFANKIKTSMHSRGVLIVIERHPADWNKYGNAAGPIRNKQMVDLGADKGLAFNKNRSRGTSGTIKLMHEAKIDVAVYTR